MSLGSPALPVSGAEGTEDAAPAAEALLLSDTEAREDPSEQIVAIHHTRDLAKRVLRLAQLLRHQLASAPLTQLLTARFHVPASACQGVEMPAARGDAARFHRLE